MSKNRRIDVKRIYVERFIKKNALFFNKTQIQKELELSKDALIRFLKYGRKLTNEEIIKLDEFIQEMLFSYEEEEKD